MFILSEMRMSWRVVRSHAVARTHQFGAANKSCSGSRQASGRLDALV